MAIDTKMVQIESVFLRRMAARSMGVSAMPNWLYSPQRHRRPHPCKPRQHRLCWVSQRSIHIGVYCFLLMWCRYDQS
jgi:hypothetical protein